MAKTNIGRVSVVPKSEYSSTENYKRLDVVNGDGSMYISKKDNNIGNPLTDENWWFKAVEKGEVGAQGEKPVNGVDYNTAEEKEEFKNDVVSKATEEVEKNIADIEAEAIENYNNNADAKTEEYDTNANSKLTAYNDNATQKTEEYNSNATSKVSEYNTNATTQIETFNNNATNKTNTFDENATIKTNTFNDNYDEKMQAINEASTSIEQERVISDGKYPRALKMQVKDEQQTQIYAENDVVDDLMIKGAQLAQKTREGYNLVDFNNPSELFVTNFNFQNDILTITSSSGTFRQIIYDITNLMVNNPGKILSFWYSSLDFSQGKLPAVQITITKKDNTKSYTQLLSSNLSKSNFNIPIDISEYSSLQLEILCNNTSESTFASISITKPMLLIGTEEKPYEQYGASPSLDYPSDIQVVNEQKILICRKNLIKSIQFMDNMNTYGWVLRFKAPLKPNTKYTIGLKGAKNNKYYLAEDLVVGGGTVNTVTMTGNMQYFTFTTKDNINVTPTYVENEGGYILLKNIIKQPNAHIFEDMILVEGTVNEAYEAYEGQELSIPLQNLTIGDYSDVIDKDSGIQDKLVQEIIFDGTENWILGNEKEKTKVFHINIDMTAIYGIGICNYLPYRSNVDEELINYAGGAIYIAINKTRISNSEELKALLAQLYQSGKPIKLYLVRQDAIKIPLSEEVKQELDKFKLFNGLNNVFIDNGSLSFKYNKSLLRALQEKDDEIYNLQSQIDEIKALLSSTSTASLLLENLANDNESEVS